MSILSFQEVSYAYDQENVLDNITFDIPEGKIIGLIGANGAGKSTLIKHIVRYLTPDKGMIKYMNKDIYELADNMFPISYIPDEPVVFDELTVIEHLMFISAVYGTNKDMEKLIDRLELQDHLFKTPFALSKGTMQKLSIGCALLKPHKILVADEPFTGLDPKQINNLKKIFVEEKEQGKTVLLSTHLLEVVENTCEYFIFIEKGRLKIRGSLEEIRGELSATSLEEVYLLLENIDACRE